MQNIMSMIQRHFNDNDPVTTYVMPALKIAAIIAIAAIILRYSGRWVDRIFNMRRIDEKRAATLSRLLKSGIRYAVYFIAAFTVLINLGVDLMPIFAGAGIVGLAVGFGAQNLVRDVITGFFLIFEDQLHVGDYVQINGDITGTVEEIGLRVTKIREWSERLHYLSNGEITQVANYNRDQMRALVDVVVPYEEDQEKVEDTLERLLGQLAKEHEAILLDNPSIYGISNLDSDGVRYTVMAVTVPGEHWFMERQMRKAIIRAFQSQHIPIAYPKRVLYSAPDESGWPAPVSRHHAPDRKKT